MATETSRFKVHFQLNAQGEELQVRAYSLWGESRTRTKLPPRSMLRRFQLSQEKRQTQSTLLPFGQALYQALVDGDVADLTNQAIHEASQAKGTVQFEIRLDPDQVALAQYPWEIIADHWGRFLVREELVDITRYITYPQPPPVIDPALVEKPLLRVVSRPQGLPPIQTPTIPLEAVRTVEHASYQGFVQTLLFERMGLCGFQFDGHGAVFPRCPHCRRINYPDQVQCYVCGKSLQDAPRIGVLAFESPNGQVEWIPTDEIGSLLYNAKILFAMLMACDTASVGGKLVFSSLAPNLILAGVPIVIGMQYPVKDRFANQFAKTFYRVFREERNILSAVRAARRNNLLEQWYSPVVYMRYRRKAEMQAGHLPALRSRRVDTALPSQVQAGERFLARLWIRRPETAALSPEDLRAELNAPDNVALSVEEGITPFRFEPLDAIATKRRTLRRGKVQIQMSAMGCDVTPQRLSLFVDEHLDAPPAIFTLRAIRTGNLSVTFKILQEGVLIASAVHQVLASEKHISQEIRLQTATQTLNVDEKGRMVTTTRKCEQCGADNRLNAAFCRQCGSQLLSDEPPVTSYDELMLSCPSCLTTNRQGVSYCRNCGQALAKPESLRSWHDPESTARTRPISKPPPSVTLLSETPSEPPEDEP